MEHLHWPFFEPEHRSLAERLDTFAGRELDVDHHDVDTACRTLVERMGQSGLLELTAPNPAEPDARLDVRSLCLARETLARYEPLADFAFAMQGLGAGAVSLFGTRDQRERWLPRTRSGHAIAAFALSEPRSGSDVANLDCRAEERDGGFVLTGEKTWISNGGIADVYVVFARTGGPGSRGISAFIVPGDVAGLQIAERLDVIAPHPLARLTFNDVELGADALIGEQGQGFKIAMSVLDVFRSTVGAAALGMARCALEASLQRSQNRSLFGAPMNDLQLIQGMLADMATDVDAAALLVYRAAWTKDQGAERVTREAAMAKLFATEAAQRVIDHAVQIHGGDGVRSGHIVERLYREIRALRIYEGASEVQRVVIARQTASGGQRHA